MAFLTAEWRKLALANYEVDKNVLSRFLPAKTELDLWNDRCFVSLVGFMFQNTKVLGLKIPFHSDFEEVNLRFYVRFKDNNQWKRGVVFIKEIVPKPAITFIARNLYGENYETMRMEHSWSEDNGKLNVSYKWNKAGKWNSIQVTCGDQCSLLQHGSKSEFITEHYWGYTKNNERDTFEYEVRHPRWKVYEVFDHAIDVDFSSVYGVQFADLNHRQPSSVMLAEGSEISVEKKRVLI